MSRYTRSVHDPLMRLLSSRSGIPILVFLSASAPLLGQKANEILSWDEYRVIMWVGDTAYKRPDKLPLFYRRLREMGVNTAMVYSDGDPRPLVDAQMLYYVENVINRGLCLKFHSKVTDWDKFVTDWAKGGRAETSFVRDYCLDDPEWLGWAQKQMQLIVRKNVQCNPLAFNIRDELSTTISANPFDYDFNPITLNQFRSWLKTQYDGLGALNSEWETRFNSWDEVKPFSTDQIKNRMASGEALPRGKPDWPELQALQFNPVRARQTPARWNFSPWADFRTYMDLSLARALDQIRRAAHEVDPRTPIGIEGTQMPNAFGGYDLWRLAQALDWVEPYDIGCAREIFGCFMHGKPILTTVFEQDTNHARRRLWHLLLQGDRGCIVWWSEDCIDWQTEDYRLTPKARALAPALREMTSPLAQLFLRAKPVHDPIFLHYSQPSIQADWLLESTIDGSTWPRRFSSFEAEHNRQAKVRDAWLKAFQDLGYSPQFISSEQIETDALHETETTGKILVLPSSWAFTAAETSKINLWLRSNASRPSFVFFDGTPGVFDEHGRLRVQAALGDFDTFTNGLRTCIALNQGGAQAKWQGDITAYLVDRVKPKASSEFTAWIQSQLPNPKLEVSVPVDARVRTYRFRHGDALLLAFQRNIDYRMSEDLTQAGVNEALEKPIELRALLKTAQHTYDLQHKRYLGFNKEIQFTLDPWQPSLFAVANDRKTVESLLR
jgi:hypothetical protein